MNNNGVKRYASEEYVNSLLESANVQPDWNVNDETDPAFISNRTHYEKAVRSVEIFSNKTYSFLYNGYNHPNAKIDSFANAPITEGCIIEIVIDGKSYFDTVTDNLGNSVLINGADNGQNIKFYYAYYSGELFINQSFGEGAHTISVYVVRHFELKELDEKYIPDTIARKSDIIQPDWNQNDSSSAAYIQNKPFESIIEHKDIVLEFDGSLDGREYIDIVELLDNDSTFAIAPATDDYFVKVSDEVPTDINAFVGGMYSVIYSDTDTEFPAVIEQDMIYTINDDIYVLGDGAALVVTDDAFIGRVYVPKGIWLKACHEKHTGLIYSYIKQLSYSGDFETLTKLDKKFLPDTTKYQGDWNQNDKSASSYIKNRPFYTKDNPEEKVVDATVEIDSELYTEISNNLYFTEGETHRVVFNGTEYTCVAWNGNGCVIIGNGSIYGGEGLGEDVPFSCDSYNNGSCYLNVSSEGTYTIEIYKVVDLVVKLDEKYLPILEEVYETVIEVDGIEVDEDGYVELNDESYKKITGKCKVTVDGNSEIVEFKEYGSSYLISNYGGNYNTDITTAEGSSYMIRTAEGFFGFIYYGENANPHSIKIETIKNVIKDEYLPEMDNACGVFIAEFNVTTHADIVQAVNDGKLVVARRNNVLYNISSYETDWDIEFETIQGVIVKKLSVAIDNVWKSDSTDLLYEFTSVNEYTFTTTDKTIEGAINELNAKHTEGTDQLILSSPNGTRFSITVGDDGVLTATEITE